MIDSQYKSEIFYPFEMRNRREVVRFKHNGASVFTRNIRGVVPSLSIVMFTVHPLTRSIESAKVSPCVRAFVIAAMGSFTLTTRGTCVGTGGLSSSLMRGILYDTWPREDGKSDSVPYHLPRQTESKRECIIIRSII